MTRTIEFLCIGTGAALWLVGAVTAAPTIGAPQLVLMSVPILCLAGVATLHPQPRRWPAHVAAGALGAALACVVALALLYASSRCCGGLPSSWPWLVPAAAIPGGLAAACLSLRRGLALAGGFSGTLCVFLGLGVTPAPLSGGVITLLIAGTLAGLTTSALIELDR
ncbi:MAG: hypothetical protein H6713_42410 [Myxococcales bacterium]|nr:hypothetical protein [Myxococcales bacterium]